MIEKYKHTSFLFSIGLDNEELLFIDTLIPKLESKETSVLEAIEYIIKEMNTNYKFHHTTVSFIGLNEDVNTLLIHKVKQ